jgi:hypothetical protein
VLQVIVEDTWVMMVPLMFSKYLYVSFFLKQMRKAVFVWLKNHLDPYYPAITFVSGKRLL